MGNVQLAAANTQMADELARLNAINTQRRRLITAAGGGGGGVGGAASLGTQAAAGAARFAGSSGGEVDSGNYL